MTFPVVAARTTTAEGSASAAHAINLGAPNAGDLLVVFAGASISGGTGFVVDTTASGADWTMIGTGQVGSPRIAVFAKVAQGGGADALTLLTFSSVRVSALCYRVTGHGSTVAGGSTAGAASTNGNPPSASITGAAQDVLFLTAMASVSSVASAAPTNYGTLTTASASSFLSAAERALNATSDDPGTFTNTNQEWIATTVAIPELAITANARTSQVASEAASNVNALMQTSQIVEEVVSANALNMMATQVCAEIVSENVPDDTATAQPTMLFIAT